MHKKHQRQKLKISVGILIALIFSASPISAGNIASLMPLAGSYEKQQNTQSLQSTAQSSPEEDSNFIMPTIPLRKNAPLPAPLLAPDEKKTQNNIPPLNQ